MATSTAVALPVWPPEAPLRADTEPVFGGGVSLDLPLELLEEVASLAPILSLSSWHSLDEADRAALRAHLPPGIGEGEGEELDVRLMQHATSARSF